MALAQCLDGDTLDLARGLVAALEAGNGAEATRLLGDLTRVQESAVFQEMGRLTRQLHDALARLKLDDHLVGLTAAEIPEAKERLAYVVRLTEEAANQTLNAVELSLPVTAQLQERATTLARSWDRAALSPAGPGPTMDLSVADFLGQVARDSEQLHGHLASVLMAQGFQDLTGQVLRRVTRLVQDVEDSLVNIMRQSDPRAAPEARREETRHCAEDPGPSCGRAGQGGVVASQDEVDALLSSLGF
jgi:chemotaxis protein CheZ